MAKMKQTKIFKIGKDVEQLALSYSVSRSVLWKLFWKTA